MKWKQLKLYDFNAKNWMNDLLCLTMENDVYAFQDFITRFDGPFNLICSYLDNSLKHSSSYPKLA